MSSNFGTLPIDLTGVHFGDTQPFSAFSFGSEILNPGEYIVLTENLAAFQAHYGAGIRVAGAWPAGDCY